MILFILYVILSTSGLILFKLGSPDLSMGFVKNMFSLNLPLLSLIGLMCYLVSFLLWMYIISKSEINFIVPLGVGVTNLAILGASYFVLNETISYTTIIGAALIIIGVVVMNVK